MKLRIVHSEQPERGHFPAPQACNFFHTPEGHPAIRWTAYGWQPLGPSELVFPRDVSDVVEIDQAQATEIHRSSAFARGYAFGAGKFAAVGALTGGAGGAKSGGLAGFIVGALIGALALGAVGWVIGLVFGALSRSFTGSDPVGACQIAYTNEQECPVTFTLCGPLPIVTELLQSFRNAQRALQ